MDFLERFKELIDEYDYTISEVAAKTNLPRSTISSYINRKSQPSVIQLDAIASLFGCSVDYLMGRTDDFGNITVSPGQLTDQLSAQEKELLDAFNLLGPFERDGILVQVKALAKMNNKNLIKK